MGKQIIIKRDAQQYTFGDGFELRRRIFGTLVVVDSDDRVMFEQRIENGRREVIEVKLKGYDSTDSALENLPVHRGA